MSIMIYRYNRLSLINLELVLIIGKMIVPTYTKNNSERRLYINLYYQVVIYY